MSVRAADHVIRPILAAVLVVSGLKMLGVSSVVVGVIGLVLVAAALATGLRHRGSPVVAVDPPGSTSDRG